ncbi:MAG: hypothetical protein HY934_03220 [Candidatus Firestonebacteria bacterium]|nr:hypothetical protein [Candidatus Firestonebacteria bacterium]
MKLFKNIILIILIFILAGHVFANDNKSERPVLSQEVKKNLEFLKNQMDTLDIEVRQTNNPTIISLYSKVREHSKKAYDYFILKKFILAASEANKAGTLINEVKIWLNRTQSERVNTITVPSNLLNEIKSESYKSQAETMYTQLINELESVLSRIQKNIRFTPKINQLLERIKKQLELSRVLVIERKKYKAAIDEMKIADEQIKNLKNILSESKTLNSETQQSNLNDDKKIKNELSKLDRLIIEVNEKIKNTQNNEALSLLVDSKTFKETAKKLYEKQQYPDAIENIYTATRLSLRALDLIGKDQKTPQNIEEDKALHKYEKFKNLFDEAKKIAHNNSDIKISNWMEQIEIKKNKAESLLQNKKYKSAIDVLQENINLCINVITYEK